jgi:hypothetical protein
LGSKVKEIRKRKKGGGRKRTFEPEEDGIPLLLVPVGERIEVPRANVRKYRETESS